ncbi:hypothetical protein K491DRAFT_679703 [Lophiostoma macrostomum CBS 122681]|uniref:Methyltransferase type 11 domain-containing protein n=1 Tax=Lophiostoma macrostomum CBS 122681 TaxID=1314788 RepID=A0A6A6T697_9PLEO|nr:hypothetical protein K491DRAFT_679703 [Lophiostoma macrostomum CBS 122681]
MDLSLVEEGGSLKRFIEILGWSFQTPQVERSFGIGPTPTTLQLHTDEARSYHGATTFSKTRRHGRPCRKILSSFESNMKRFPFFGHLHRITNSSISTATARISAFAWASSNMSTSPSPSQPQPFPIKRYEPQHSSWPYKASDFSRHDETPDDIFYAAPRINVQHIDAYAIANLKRYYQDALPETGQIVDLCTSWTSHFPANVIEAVDNKELKVFGVGMNTDEMEANPHLTRGWVSWDLNADPEFLLLHGPMGQRVHGEEAERFDAATCVVSIDYLTKPREVLQHLREQHMKEGGTVHLVISNRRFPTKAIRMWESASEDDRLQIVGDYLHFSGWKDIEIVDLSGSQGQDSQDQSQAGVSRFLSALLGRGHDPLWVVRGVKRG